MAKSEKRAPKKKRVAVIATRTSDVSGFEVYAIDTESDEQRLATVFLRGKKKQAEYAVFLSEADAVDPAATGALKTDGEDWDDEAREQLVRDAIEASGVDLPFVADDVQFLWDVEADETDEADDEDYGDLADDEDLSDEGAE